MVLPSSFMIITSSIPCDRGARFSGALLEGSESGIRSTTPQHARGRAGPTRARERAQSTHRDRLDVQLLERCTQLLLVEHVRLLHGLHITALRALASGLGTARTGAAAGRGGRARGVSTREARTGPRRKRSAGGRTLCRQTLPSTSRALLRPRRRPSGSKGGWGKHPECRQGWGGD
jgi:hypothetical protein